MNNQCAPVNNFELYLFIIYVILYYNYGLVIFSRKPYISS